MSKRYVWDHIAAQLTPREDGEWVRYSDLAAAHAEIERLTVELAGWKQAARQMEAERDDAQTDLGKVILALPTGTGERAAGPVEGVKTMRKRLEAERDEARAEQAVLLERAAERMDAGFSYNAGNRVRGVIPDDAQAALEAYGLDKVREGAVDAWNAAGLILESGIPADVAARQMRESATILAEMETLK